jgi:hypothetical protein
MCVRSAAIISYKILPSLEFVRGHLIVVLKCYFDSGNQSDSTQYDVITLAAMAGTYKQWKPFERAWTRNLKKHGAPYLHTTDAVCMNTPFSKKNGWTPPKVEAFLKDCVKVCGKYMARPITDDYEGKIGIYPYTVTIVLKDYIRARNEVDGLPNSVDEVLAVDTMNTLFTFARDYGGTEYFDLVYDQNEPFRGYILDRQRSPKAVKALPMFSKIISNTEANMRFVPALQLADLWAWCYSHKKEAQFEWHKKMLSHPVNEAYGDYEKLRKPYKETIELNQSFRFPRRKPTR